MVRRIIAVSSILLREHHVMLLPEDLRKARNLGGRGRQHVYR
jgi:hypothetical protein